MSKKSKSAVVEQLENYLKTEKQLMLFAFALKKNGLRKIRFHDLRHSCASLLLKNGVAMKDIQAWLGHSNYNTTAELYTHLDVASKDQTGAAMACAMDISRALAVPQS